MQSGPPIMSFGFISVLSLACLCLYLMIHCVCQPVHTPLCRQAVNADCLQQILSLLCVVHSCHSTFVQVFAFMCFFVKLLHVLLNVCAQCCQVAES